jgi:hypothetical protein
MQLRNKDSRVSMQLRKRDFSAVEKGHKVRYEGQEIDFRVP